MSDQEFVGHRLVRGVYGQRQPDRQMMRIKIPLGFLHANQLEVLANVIEQYAPLGKGHWTTREKPRRLQSPANSRAYRCALGLPLFCRIAVLRWRGKIAVLRWRGKMELPS